jgi:hypothetical protein
MQDLGVNLNSNLLLVHAFTCFFLTGLIWTIQLVHYPSFAFVDPKLFSEFSSFHGFRISLIVVPLMVIELITAGMLLGLHEGGGKNLFTLNLIMVGLIWASTFFLSVPLHTKLSQGYDKSSIELLVLTNWPRTIIWSLRSASLMWLLGFRFV